MATRSKHFSKPADLIRTTAEELKREGADQVKARELLSKGVESDYRELTSGNVTTRELRRMGHPFARENPPGRQRGRLGRLPINKQTGALYNSIRRRWRFGRGLNVTFYIGFDPRVAGRSLYVVQEHGTSRMVPRGFSEEITKRLKARRLGMHRYLEGRI